MRGPESGGEIANAKAPGWRFGWLFSGVISGREMARVTGLEPATSGVTGRHSNRLSYTRASQIFICVYFRGTGWRE
ncbi:hypothetical protein AGR3A_Cc260204 [Agrobacterium tomkonis CFBP 6623]|uniref:Uncharacterized protein n=1 Tax=Agrobacterium tomkonis CFBP 6623 TaxID=1183432 RepID=A0A1S7PKH8_9HYPH|nr:hypothetical protein AGR3A_Cc260204 [Agrobacterium tomkonis CFBP 6623]